MTMLNVLTSLFIMTALYGTGRNRFQIFIGFAALIAAPAAFGIVSGANGVTYSLVGAGAALFLTIPLSLLGFVSHTDVIISIALGGALGAVNYAIVFCIATAILSIQRMLRIENALPVAVSDSSPYGTGLLAFDEKSALVEIEAMRMLRMDRKDSAGSARTEVYESGEPGRESAGPFRAMPWCAKLAVATLVVLMIGTTF
jgi:hypothetical protein